MVLHSSLPPGNFSVVYVCLQSLLIQNSGVSPSPYSLNTFFPSRVVTCMLITPHLHLPLPALYFPGISQSFWHWIQSFFSFQQQCAFYPEVCARFFGLLPRNLGVAEFTGLRFHSWTRNLCFYLIPWLDLTFLDIKLLNDILLSFTRPLPIRHSINIC